MVHKKNWWKVEIACHYFQQKYVLFRIIWSPDSENFTLLEKKEFLWEKNLILEKKQEHLSQKKNKLEKTKNHLFWPDFQKFWLRRKTFFTKYGPQAMRARKIKLVDLKKEVDKTEVLSQW